MNIRKILDTVKKPFEKGQKFEKYAPAVNAFDTFLFVPNHTTKHGAHIRDAVDLKRTMITVIIALLPALLYGIYNTGFQYYSQLGSRMRETTYTPGTKTVSLLLSKTEITLFLQNIHGSRKNFQKN